MVLLAWGLISGLLVSIAVTWWPATWQYIPGIIFGTAIALYFSKLAWVSYHREIGKLSAKLLGFVGLAYLAYSVALHEAEWVLGTNGFATFDSYREASAISALFVACFVGGCIGAFILALGIRLLYIRFDVVRGLFLFSLFCGAVGSIVAFGFETFGFIPQFIFPIWDAGMMVLIQYLSSISEPW